MTEKSVIDTLNAAVENDPANTTLRVHLASVLAENRLFDDAARHLQYVLSQEPLHLDAMMAIS